MPVKIYKWFDDWKSEKLVCEKCGWSGDFSAGLQEDYSDLFDVSCPKCFEMVAVVGFPTLKENEENWEKLSEADQKAHVLQKMIWEEFQERSLKDPAQLPEISEESFVLEWNQEQNEGSRDQTTLRLNGKLIFREPAVYEGSRRFAEVVSILVQKYGTRLEDVVPLSPSHLYLFGDNLGSINSVKATRERVRGTLLPES